MSSAQDNSTLLHTILDSVADGVFTVDNEMQITSFNRKKQGVRSAVDLRLIRGKLLSCQDHYAYNIRVLGTT